jgi:hypothetical protein
VFFALAPEPDNRFPNHDKFGTYWFSHDDGWSNSDSHWYKGYNYPQLGHGNFLKLNLVTDNEVLLEHDTVRGFPLWWDNQTQKLTNLLGTGLQIWNDKTVSVRNHWLHDIDMTDYTHFVSKQMSFDSVVDLICENLVAKAHALKNSELEIPKKIFLTGGIDTATIYSVLKYVNIDVELIDYEYIKYDSFLNKNFFELKENHWGYKQTHHWTQSTLLISGAYGDEFLMRGPQAVAWWTAFNDIDIVDLLKKNCNVYHHKYFLKEKNVSIFNAAWSSKLSIKNNCKNIDNLNSQIVNTISNDYQHWHLGNTLTWTPFKDIEILKICLNLNAQDLTDHVINATINKGVIEKMYPSARLIVSRQKNINSRENL